MVRKKLSEHGNSKPVDDDVKPQTINAFTNHGFNAGCWMYSWWIELRKQAFQYRLGLYVRPKVYHFALSSDKEHL